MVGRGKFVLEFLEKRKLMTAVGDAYMAPADPRVVAGLNSSWKFSLSAGAAAQGAAVNDSAWSTVNLPHTWNGTDGQDGGGNYYRGIGWYRKTISAPVGTAGDDYYLHFDGASLVTSVFVDGQAIGQHSGAFGGFDFDLTAALADGQPHLLAVEVDNSASLSATVAPTIGSDFNVDGGLYRGVSLLATAPQHVTLGDSASSGVFFTASNVSAAQATIQIATELNNTGLADRPVVIHSVLVDGSGTVVADSQSGQTLTAGAPATVTQSTTVANPHLWNGVTDPYLHDLYVEVRDAATGQLIDLVHQRVGIRSFAIDPNRGFLLNGQPYELHGFSYHQDRLNKGWAISDNDTRSDIATMLDIGATAVRSHYQLSPLFYDLADQTGLIVISEVPLNGSKNTSLSISDALLASAKQQMTELIRQNYNRPSIVAWGLYNELQDTAQNDSAIAQLNSFVHAMDPMRVTEGQTWNSGVGTLEKSADLIGENLYKGWYIGSSSEVGPILDALHRNSPGSDFGIIEYGAGGSINQHGDFAHVDPFGGWHPEDFQSLVHEQTWLTLSTRSYLWAKMSWQMFDSASDGRNDGPVSGVNDKGMVGLDHTTKKDAYYFYRSVWSAAPTLYITDRRYTTRTAATTDIKIYSNLDAVELFVNGVDLGAMTRTQPGVFVTSAVTLAAGANVVTVNGIKANQTYSDTATWTYTPPSASVSGYAFTDTDASGTLNGSEAGTAGVAIFLDANNNAALDTGETSVLTDANGAFTFGGLAAGTYHVRSVLAANTAYSTPPIDVLLADAQAVTALAIGVKSTLVVPPVVVPPVVVPPVVVPPVVVPPVVVPPVVVPPVVVPSASLSGFTFDDADLSGTWNGTEAKTAGKTVFLDTNNNGVLDAGELSMATGANGVFSFSGLAAGTYHLRRVFPGGWTYSTASIDLVIADGQAVAGLAIGSKSTAAVPPAVAGTASLSGFAFDDTDLSGTWNGTEAKTAGKTVYLDANNNGLLDNGELAMATGTGGAFTFTGLAAGTYHLRRVFPSGWKYSTPLIDLVLTDAQAATGLAIGSKSTTAVAPPVVIPPVVVPPVVVPPVVVPMASLGGFTFDDTNSNGLWESNEPRTVGRTVFIDANSNGSFDAGESSTITDATGAFTFTGLAAGTYHVRGVMLAGFTASTAPIDLAVAAGQIVAALAIGSKPIVMPPPVITPSASLSGFTFNDADSSGTWSSSELKTVGNQVFLDANNNGLPDTGEASAATDANGAFTFTGLAPGVYHVRWMLPANTAYSTSPIDITLTDGQAVAGLALGSKSTIVIPPVVVPSATLSGYAFTDTDASGTLNGSEAGTAGVAIFLDANNNAALDTGETSVLTDANGAFTFGGLAAGTYHVRSVLAANTAYSTPPIDVLLADAQAVTALAIGVKSTLVVPPVVVPPVVVPPVVVPPVVVPPVVVPPVVVPSASLSGFTFDDADLSGTWNGTEAKTAGKTVFLDTNNNGVLDSGELSMATGANGVFSFSGLAAGTYHLRRVFPGGWTYSTASIDLVIADGQAVAGLAIGSKSTAAVPPAVAGTASLSGFAFDDTDLSGTWNGTEAKTAGKTVYLDTNNNGLLDNGELAMATGTGGAFTFTGLAAGTYHLRRVFPSGWKYSTPLIDLVLTDAQAATGLSIGSRPI